MLCPNCQTKFKKVLAKCWYNFNVELDQCPNCGGIWCDKYELYRVSPEGVETIEKLDVKKLREFKPIKKDLICPRCKIALEEFKDPYFPKQIKLGHCPNCGGFWLNRGALVKFKEWQQKRKAEALRKKEDKEFSQEIKKMLISQRKNPFKVWGEAGKFLSQRIHPFQIKPKVELESEEAAKVVAYVFIIIQIVTQIISKFIK